MAVDNIARALALNAGSGGGTAVEANPTSYPQDAPNLEALKVGENYYKVPVGGGGGSDFPEGGNNDDVITKIVVPGELVGTEINPTSNYEHIYLNCDQQDDDEIRRIISLVSDSGSSGKQIYDGDNDLNLIDFQNFAPLGADGLVVNGNTVVYLYVFEDVDLGVEIIYKGWILLYEISGNITPVTGVADLGSFTNGSEIQDDINSELTKIFSAGVEFQEIGRIESVEWRPGIPGGANDGDMLGYTVLPPSRTGKIIDPEENYEHIYLNCDLSGDDIQNIIDKLNGSDMYEQGTAYAYDVDSSNVELMLRDAESGISAPGLLVGGSNDSADNIVYIYVFNNIGSTVVGDLIKGWNTVDMSTGSATPVSGIVDLGGFSNGRGLWTDECINDSLSNLFSAGEIFIESPSQSKYEWKPGVPKGGENNQVLTRVIVGDKYEGNIPTEDGTITSVYCNCGSDNIDTILNFVKGLDYDSNGVYKFATVADGDDPNCWLQIKKYAPNTYPEGMGLNTKDSYAIGLGQASWVSGFFGKQIAILDEDIFIAFLTGKRGVNFIDFDNTMIYSSGKFTIAEDLNISYTDFDSDVVSWLKSFVSYNEDLTLIEKAKDGIEWRDPTGGGGTSGGIAYSVEEPTADNLDGLKFVVLENEPVQKYNGYIYFITPRTQTEE